MSEASHNGLPKGWAAVPLGQIASINPALEQEVVGDDTVVTFVPMRAVEPNGGGLKASETRRYSEVKKGYTAFQSGDVIMAKITPCMENGKTTVVPDVPGRVCFGSTEFHTIRPERGILAQWIAQFLLQHETRRAAQRQMTGGVGQMRVPASFLDTLDVPLAPAAEQARIADALDELFSDLDAGVASLEQVRGKLKAYRASVLKTAVDGMLTAKWREEHADVEPASVLLDRILVERRRRWEEEQLAKFESKGQRPPKNWKSKYREPLGPDVGALPVLPAKWTWATLDQLAWRLRSGNAASSGRTATDYPVLKSSAVRHGAVNFTDLNYLRYEQSGNEDNFLRAGDFLITRLSGSVEYVGCTAWVDQLPHTRTQYPDRIFCAKLVTGAHGEYLTFCFQHSRIRGILEAAAKSTAGHQRISISDLRDLPAPLPPVPEQEAIVELVEDQLSVIDHLEADLDAKLKSAQSLRQSILRHAFSGQLVPQDPNVEPTSELLTRIAAEREARRAAPRRPKRRVVRSAV